MKELTKLLKIFVVLLVFTSSNSFGYSNKKTEKYYQHKWCMDNNGVEEFLLYDKTRVDCLTDIYACEFDWANKWYEGFGQALWYAHNTNKKPCLVIIIKNNNDYKHLNRAKILCNKYDINLIEIK